MGLALATGSLGIILRWILELRSRKRMARVKKTRVGEGMQTEKGESRNVGASYIY